MLHCHSSWNSSSKDVQSGLYGGPLAIFDKTGSTIVMSAFNEFMASSVYYDPSQNAVMQGVMGKVKEIPKGYKLQTVIHFGMGLKKVCCSKVNFISNIFKSDCKTEA